MAWGRRCGSGCESWPDHPLFIDCPICGDKTTRFKNLSPLPFDEAESRLKHIEFQRFYEERCQRLGIPSDDGPPDALPALDYVA